MKKIILLIILFGIPLTACNTKLTKPKELYCPAPPIPVCVPLAAPNAEKNVVFIDEYGVKSIYMTTFVSGVNSLSDEWQLSFESENNALLTFTDYNLIKTVSVAKVNVDRFRYKGKFLPEYDLHIGAISISNNIAVFAESNYVANDEEYLLPTESVIGQSRLKIGEYKNNTLENIKDINDFEIDLLEWQSHPAIYADDEVIFFASDRDGGYGGTDIWFIVLQNEKWSEPINCGNIINTACDELTPFITINNNELYFASTGHNNFGGFDIFKSEIKKDFYNFIKSKKELDGDFSEYFGKPVNLGSTVNTKYDEFFPSSFADCDSLLYFSSNRPVPIPMTYDGYNILVRRKVPEELFIALQKEEQKEEINLIVDVKPEVKQLPQFTYTGVVKNMETADPISNATIIATDIAKKTIEVETTSDEQGKFSMQLHKGTEYEISARSEYTFFDTKNVFVDEMDTTLFINDEFVLPELFELRINFPTDVYNNPYKFVLDADGNETNTTYIEEIERLANDLLRSQARLQKVLLVGHTDDVGSIEYNYGLGKRRVDFVINELILRGVPENILESRSAGELEPLKRREGEELKNYRKRLRRVTLEKVYR